MLPMYVWIAVMVVDLLAQFFCFDVDEDYPAIWEFVSG